LHSVRDAATGCRTVGSSTAL